MRFHHLLLGGALVAMAPAAQAALITQSFAFTASNYTLSFGDGSVAPIDPAGFVFTVTFDNSQTYEMETAGLTFASNVPYAATFAYNPVNDTLVLATFANSSFCSNPANSFCNLIGNFSTDPSVILAQQSTSTGGYWVAHTITPGADLGGVPEPGVWAMLLVGFGALGATLRRRSKVRIAYS